MSRSHETNKDSGFAFGMILGAIFGGGSLFFFGTKAGKKIKAQLQEEFKEGGFEFKAIKEDTFKKLQEIIENSNIQELISQTHSTPEKTKSPRKKKKTKAKKFFSNTKSNKSS